MIKLFNCLNGRLKFMPLLSFDIETKIDEKNKGQFLFGGIYNGQDYISFIDRIKMKKFMSRRWFKGSIWLAHNLEYDLNRIFLDDDKLIRYYMSSRLIFAKYPVDSDHYVYFYDTSALSDFSSLELIGEKMGYKKKHIEFSNNITRKYIDYNQRDCEITWKYATEFQKFVNSLGGNFKPTLASIALDIYRRKYMRKDWSYYKLSDDMLEVFRNAYYGGRCEIFSFKEYDYKKTKSFVNYFDINSSYPSSMLNTFPLLSDYTCKADIDKEGISYIKADIKDCYYPPLPYRKDGKLFFPIGKLSGWYCNNEIRLMKKLSNFDFKVIKGFTFNKSDNIFKDYIIDLYTLRQKQTNEIYNYICKKLMNALYGKFGLRNFLEIFKGKEKSVANSIPVFANVIWSAYTTSYSRVKLYELLLKSESIYCDTDSSISESNLSCSKTLGDIGLKEKYSYFQAFMPKHYIYANKDNKKHYRIKGLPKNYFKNPDGSYTYETPIKFKSAMRRKIPLWAWINVTKVFNENYDKRIKLTNGQTRPLDVKNL